MADERTVSEEMVKLIFNPIKESLAAATAAINESTVQVRDLVHIFSTPPSRAELKEYIGNLIQSHTNDAATRNSALQVSVKETILEIREEVRESLDNLTETFNKVGEGLAANNRAMNDLINSTKDLNTSLTTTVKDLHNRINLLIGIVGAAFTIAMAAWAVIAFFFNVPKPGGG